MSSSTERSSHEHGKTSSMDPVIPRNPAFVPAVEMRTDPQPPPTGTFKDIRTGKIICSL